MTSSPKEVFKRDNDYGFNCVDDGAWYSCGWGSKFVGCCAGEACTNGCSQGNLRNSTFDKSKYGQFPDLECPSGSNFYTCTGISPPFLGCCKQNPCALGGCPAGELAAAALGNNQVQLSAYSATGAPNSSHHTNAGAIAGGVIGGLVVIAIIIGFLIYYLRNTASRKAQYGGLQDQDPGTHDMALAEKRGVHSPAYSPNLPPYSSPAPVYAYYNPSSASDHGRTEHQSYFVELPGSDRVSELSDGIQRVELESPVPSAKQSPNPNVGSPLKTSFEPTQKPLPPMSNWQEVQRERVQDDIRRDFRDRL